MVAKKRAKTLKSNTFKSRSTPYPTSFKNLIAQVTTASTVGVGSGLGVVRPKMYGMGAFLDFMVTEGLTGDQMAEVIKAFLDAKHNL